ncbi:MAG: hypothetical protein PHW47_09145 [Lachnospira sp.]|nr:hypothetical protein [Lachnospira sp.]
MLSNATLSPHSRGIPDIDDRIAKLEKYEQQFTPITIDFEEIVGKALWKQHWENCQKLHDLMKESQEHSDNIKEIIYSAIKE